MEVRHLTDLTCPFLLSKALDAISAHYKELLREIAYNQAPIQTEHGPALVTTAFVSALASLLLLAEVIKEAADLAT